MPAKRHRPFPPILAASLLAVGLAALAAPTTVLRAQELQSGDAEAAAAKPKKNWFQQSNPSACSGVNPICQIFYDATPAGKLVTLTSVSCTFRTVSASLDTIRLTVLKNAKVVTAVALRPVSVDLQRVLATRNYAVNDDVTVYVPSGAQAVISSQSNGDATSQGRLTCHIAGTLQ